MVYHGHVKNGRIELDEPARLPEGVPVEVSVPQSVVPDSREGADEGPSLYDEMKEFVGIATDLPPDAAVNLDHYLYGHPKK